MLKKFDSFINLILEADSAMPPSPADNATPEQISNGEESIDPNEDIPEDNIEEEPVYLEEIELGKLAVRALHFNVDSKDVHKFNIKYKGEKIPFEKVPDFFEQTKNTKAVLGFIEYVMDYYEGVHSKWSEEKEFKGKNIIQKIEAINANAAPEEKLDNGKRVYWTRLILNCLLYGGPEYNLVMTDITPENINEVFSMLKQHFGHDTRGLKQGIDLRGPATF